jgi:outer membrane biosynthesis protein TonB
VKKMVGNAAMAALVAGGLLLFDATALAAQPHAAAPRASRGDDGPCYSAGDDDGDEYDAYDEYDEDMYEADVSCGKPAHQCPKGYEMKCIKEVKEVKEEVTTDSKVTKPKVTTTVPKKVKKVTTTVPKKVTTTVPKKVTTTAPKKVTTTKPEPAEPPAEPPEPPAEPPAKLPVTGGPSAAQSVLGGVLVAAGAGLVAVSRRRLGRTGR